MRKSLFFFIFFMLSGSVHAEKDRLAVMDVTDEDGIFDEKTLNNVTDYIFTKFQGTGLFWMIPKSDRDTALDKAIEETKLSSRKECVDEKCQLSLVAELQANFLINTKIKKLYENTCQITVSKFDVEKRAGVFSWDKRFDCSSKGVFDSIDGFDLKNEPSEKLIKKEKYQWSKRSLEKLSWSESKSYCEKLSENGIDGWRLPTISELRSLVTNCPDNEPGGKCKVNDLCLDRKKCSDSCTVCSSKKNNFSKLGDTEMLWSSSELEDGNVTVWRIDFKTGEINFDYRSAKNFVRCVAETENPTVVNAPNNSFPSKNRNYSWSEKALILMDWNKSKKYCENLEENGYSDWRLPTLSELRTLIQNCPSTEVSGECKISNTCLSSFSCKNDACNGCSKNKAGKYSKYGDIEKLWSSSERLDSTVDAWCVNFVDASIVSCYEGYEDAVRCVR